MYRAMVDTCCCLMVASLGLFAASADAAQSSGQFNVTINANNLVAISDKGLISPATGFCTKAFAMGVVVTIVCATGIVLDINETRTESDIPWLPMNGAVYRFAHIIKGDRILGEVNSYTEVGTVTSWSIVDLPDYDYIEMQIGW